MTVVNNNSFHNNENIVENKDTVDADVVLTEKQKISKSDTNVSVEQKQQQQQQQQQQEEEEGSNIDDIVDMQEDNEDIVAQVEDDLAKNDENVSRSCLGNGGKSYISNIDDSTREEEKVSDLTIQSIDEEKDKKRHRDDDDTVSSFPEKGKTVPIVKPKRARSAYFIFMDEKRPKVLADNPGAKVGVIAKEIGKLWSNLTLREKEPYQKKAAKEKEEYKKAMDKLRSSGLLGAEDDTNSTLKINHNQLLELPLSKIRKICRLDPEVKGISKEAVSLITKAAELFTFKFGQECSLMAKMQNRRTLLLDDVLDVTSMKEPFFFLREDMKDLTTELKNKPLISKSTGGLGRTNETTGNLSAKPITSYFSNSK